MKKITTIGLIIILLCLSACKKGSGDVFEITIGVYSKDSLGIYFDTGKELNFNSNDDCQIWSRSAMPDSHSNDTHLHYNAAKNVHFDEGTNTFTYTEYGPELDESSIQITCEEGIGGVTKSVNDQNYYQDKPNVYLKIKSIVRN